MIHLDTSLPIDILWEELAGEDGPGHRLLDRLREEIGSRLRGCLRVQSDSVSNSARTGVETT